MAGGASLSTTDYWHWRLRLECQRVGCTAHLMTVADPFEHRIRHDDDVYDLTSGPYPSSWQGIVGWLDTLHAPIVARAQLRDLWPLRTVHPLIGG
jgi:hypothetical protein